MIWWEHPQWLAYETACGLAPGTRAAELRAAAWQTRVVDLHPTEAELWTGLRKSYKALINRAKRTYGVQWSGTTPSATFIKVCQRLHREDAGRVTRPQASWDIMAEDLDLDLAVAFTACTDAGARAFVYWYRWGDWAYYGHAASLDRDVLHMLVWHAMLWLKRHGARVAEVGWQGHATDTKGQQVEFFKAGFGGRSLPVREVVAA